MIDYDSSKVFHRLVTIYSLRSVLKIISVLGDGHYISIATTFVVASF